MFPTEILSTLAEVAAVFLGFAGLATVIGQRSGVVPAGLSYMRLHVVMVWGLIVINFSLLPLLANELFPSHDRMFLVLSGILAAIFFAHEFYVDIRLYRMSRKGQYQFQIGFLFLSILPYLAVILAIANVFGAAPYNRYVIYTLCVGMGLAQASIVLLRLFLAFVPRQSTQ